MMEVELISKLAVTVVLVLLLSLVAEYVSPKMAGFLAGYPLGAAIALFFIGLENTPEFASDSAVYTLIGLVATQSFVYCYYRSTIALEKFSIPAASLCGIAGYFLVVWGLHYISVSRFLAVGIPVASVFVFIYLFRDIQNVTIEDRITLTAGILFLRALLAAGIIVIITGLAKSVGPRWAGLFSAFPITLFPLILIIHVTYDRQHVHTIIKNFPRGLGSLIIYALSVSIVYPVFGIYFGTSISLLAATGYLAIYQVVAGRINR